MYASYSVPLPVLGTEDFFFKIFVIVNTCQNFNVCPIAKDIGQPSPRKSRYHLYCMSGEVPVQVWELLISSI